MEGFDDRPLRAPCTGLDGKRLTGHQVLAIRDDIRSSDAHTDDEIDAVIHRALVAIRDGTFQG